MRFVFLFSLFICLAGCKTLPEQPVDPSDDRITHMMMFGGDHGPRY